jgi:hypothetical protein
MSRIILPFVDFRTPVLKNLLEDLRTKKISAGRDSLKIQFLLNNVEHTMGVGGLHSVNKPEAVFESDEYALEDWDVASLYPSMIIEHGFYPPHLGEEFLDTYSQIKNERIEAKHNGNTLKNLTLKLALNGLSGNLQNEHSWCYSPEAVMKIRMNGQLLLLMLAERFISVGCKIIQSNTDGLFILRPRNNEEEFKAVIKEWETITKLQLEGDSFESFYQYAINDYLAIGKGYSETKNPKLLKKKGLFIDKVTLGKGMNPPIIAKAINAYLADRVPVKQTIMGSRDINDFLTYQKVAKKFQVYYGDDMVQHINRFYMSVNGQKIQKYDAATKKYTSIVADSGVKILNNLVDVQFPNDINYAWYIEQAKKITTNFEAKQTNLFEDFFI